MIMARILSSKWTKVALFLACLIPFLRLAPPVLVALNAFPDAVAAAISQNSFFVMIGPNPVEFITHFTGDWTLRLLLITLTVTPLRDLLKLPQLTRFRRMLGLFAFFYAVLHLATWAWLDKAFDLPEMWKDILKRWYITVGMAALLGMTPLAITSTAGWVRRLGYKRWQALHRTIYFCGIAGVVHYYLLVKSDIRLPLMYAAILAVLLGYRVIKSMRTPRRVAAPRTPAPVG
jgi:methionine sulfoxide reductase heme-binding subunit